MFNNIVFPAPNPPTYSSQKFIGEVMYISNRDNGQIPCLFLPYQSGSSKIILFFHGNAEDLGISYEMLDHLRGALKINILAVEYPGYGIYQDE